MSAWWKSSKTITTGPLAASRSKNVRHAPNSCCDPASDSSPSSASSAGSIHARSDSSGTCSSSIAAIAARVVASSSVSWRWARPRTISPSAQNVIPSP